MSKNVAIAVCQKIMIKNEAIEKERLEERSRILGISNKMAKEVNGYWNKIKHIYKEASERIGLL